MGVFHHQHRAGRAEKPGQKLDRKIPRLGRPARARQSPRRVRLRQASGQQRRQQRQQRAYPGVEMLGERRPARIGVGARVEPEQAGRQWDQRRIADRAADRVALHLKMRDADLAEVSFKPGGEARFAHPCVGGQADVQAFPSRQPPGNGLEPLLFRPPPDQVALMVQLAQPLTGDGIEGGLSRLSLERQAGDLLRVEPARDRRPSIGVQRHRRAPGHAHRGGPVHRIADGDMLEIPRRADQPGEDLAGGDGGHQWPGRILRQCLRRAHGAVCPVLPHARREPPDGDADQPLVVETGMAERPALGFHCRRDGVEHVRRRASVLRSRVGEGGRAHEHHVHLAKLGHPVAPQRKPCALMRPQPGADVERGGRRRRGPGVGAHRPGDGRARIGLHPAVLRHQRPRGIAQSHAPGDKIQRRHLVEHRPAEHGLAPAGRACIDQPHVTHANARAHFDRPVADRVGADLLLDRQATGDRGAHHRRAVFARRPVYGDGIARVVENRSAVARDDVADPGEDRVDDALQHLRPAFRLCHRLRAHVRKAGEIAQQDNPRGGEASRIGPQARLQQPPRGRGKERRWPPRHRGGPGSAIRRLPSLCSKGSGSRNQRLPVQASVATDVFPLSRGLPAHRAGARIRTRSAP